MPRPLAHRSPLSWPTTQVCNQPPRPASRVSTQSVSQQRPDGRDPLHDPENYFAFVTGTGDWARHEVTAQIPPDANNIIFGIFLNGGGKIELRNPQLEPAADG
jgi:hypothetical protein